MVHGLVGMTTFGRFVLQHGDQTVELAPDVGGAIARYSIIHDDVSVDLMRATSFDTRNVLDFACFPLVPYSSRVREGRFRFEGREIRLPLNFGDHPHSIHGHGWQAPWSVSAVAPDSVTLDYDHVADAWPWAYRARQSFLLDREMLTIELSLTNLSDRSMPAGLGLHPYFPRARKARLRANVSSVWRMNAEVMPLERVPLPADCRLPEGVALRDVVLDNGFEGWDGRAEITWPELGLGLDLEASPALRRLVVYAPAGQEFFCVEPVSNMTDAFNRAAEGERDTGMRVLAPGEAFAAWMRLTPRRL